MKTLFILLVTVMLSAGVFAQEKESGPVDAMNAIYGEIGGNALFICLNYERFIQKNMSIRVGYGSAVIYGHAVPVMFNFFVGENHRLELGAGVIFLFGRERFITSYIFHDENLRMASGTFGYRYQSVDGGFVFRLGLNPSYALSEYELDRKLFLWAGMSFGAAF